MTRASQTADERRHTESFFRSLFRSLFRGEDAGLVFEYPDPPAPDVLVRGRRLAEVAGAGVDGLAVEHTEYHPAAWGSASYRRSEVDSRWQNELLPVIETTRRANPAVKSISVSFDFKDIRLPKKCEHRAIAADLVRAVEAMIPRIPLDRFINLYFFCRSELSRMPQQMDKWAFLPSEEFPLAAEHFNEICLESCPEMEWPPWFCPRVLFGWNAPSANEFSRILEAKTKKAKKYDKQGWSLWLLIVAELINDNESLIFPREQEDLLYLREQISNTGFDFANGPFQQVWLYSQFTKGTLRLYPVGSVVP